MLKSSIKVFGTQVRSLVNSHAELLATPQHVANVAAVVSPAAAGASSTVNVTFLRTPDKAYKGVRILLKGYKGNPNLTQVAAGSDSPVSFVADNTGETVQLFVQAVGSTNAASIDTAPATAFSLGGANMSGAGVSSVNYAPMGKSTPFNPQGSIVQVPNNTFSYASTTTSITWSWTSFSAYAPDGSTVTFPSGSKAFTGLSSSTTYHFGAYANFKNTTVVIAISTQSSGTAKESLQVVAQVFNGDGNSAINNDMSASTPASGSGGGGGFPYCFSGDTPVKTKRGNTPISLIQAGDFVLTARGTWKPVAQVIMHEYDGPAFRLSSGKVTPSHRFLKDGRWIRADQMGFAPTTHLGTVFNLSVEASDDGTAADTERSYTLGDGSVVHNIKGF